MDLMSHGRADYLNILRTSSAHTATSSPVMSPTYPAAVSVSSGQHSFLLSCTAASLAAVALRRSLPLYLAPDPVRTTYLHTYHCTHAHTLSVLTWASPGSDLQSPCHPSGVPSG